jgi:hypothetical protein
VHKRVLIVATVGTVLLTGAALSFAGWFRGSPARATPRRIELRTQAQAGDPFGSEAAWRHRRCQPTHWKAFMLQH